MLSAVHSADSPPATGSGPARRPGPTLRRIGLTGAAIAGSWLVSVLATVLHVDWLLAIVMLVGTAGVLRAGDALLDRLMLALTLMLGALTALGLAYSVWPWHLDPVGIGGSYLTLVVLAAALSGRRFRLPGKVRPTDLLLLGVPVYAFLRLYQPIARLNPIQRFAFNSPLEDEFTHFGFYDAIHTIGGYGFLNSSKTYPFMGHPSEKIYPQGAHFLYVLMDVFLHSSATPGDGVTEYNRFFLYTMAGFAFLTLAVGWAARWVAGPRLRGWRSALVCGCAAGFTAFGIFGFVFRTADVAEVVGLAFVALTLAVTLRAPRRTPDHLLLTAATVIAVTYAYYAFLVMIAPVLVIGFVVYRRRLRRHWRFAAAATVLAGIVAAVPLAIMESTSFNLQAQAGATGERAAVDYELLGVLFLIVVAGQLTKAGRRSPTWRMASINLLACSALVALLLVAQGEGPGNVSYYMEKLFYILLMTGLVSLGALTVFLSPGTLKSVSARLPGSSKLPGSARLSGFRGSGAGRVTATVAALAVAVALTGAYHTGSNRPVKSRPDWLLYWSNGHVMYPDEPVIAALAQRDMLMDGVQTLVAVSNDSYEDYRITRLIGVLNHHDERTDETGGYYLPLMKHIDSDSADPSGQAFHTDLTNLLGTLTPKSVPVRVVVANPQVADAVTAYVKRHPGLKVTVVVLPSSFAATGPQPRE